MYSRLSSALPHRPKHTTQTHPNYLALIPIRKFLNEILHRDDAAVFVSLDFLAHTCPRCIALEEMETAQRTFRENKGCQGRTRSRGIVLFCTVYISSLVNNNTSPFSMRAIWWSIWV